MSAFKFFHPTLMIAGLFITFLNLITPAEAVWQDTCLTAEHNTPEDTAACQEFARNACSPDPAVAFSDGSNPYCNPGEFLCKYECITPPLAPKRPSLK